MKPLRGAQAASRLLPTQSPIGNTLLSPQVVHSAALDVDEEGTEGAAATGVELSPRSAFMSIVRFDRPFLVAVVLKDTQSIIFLGKVTNPSQASELWVPSLRSGVPWSLGVAWPLGTEDPHCLSPPAHLWGGDNEFSGGSTCTGSLCPGHEEAPRPLTTINHLTWTALFPVSLPCST